MVVVKYMVAVKLYEVSAAASRGEQIWLDIDASRSSVRSRRPRQIYRVYKTNLEDGSKPTNYGWQPYSRPFVGST